MNSDSLEQDSNNTPVEAKTEEPIAETMDASSSESPLDQSLNNFSQETSVVTHEIPNPLLDFKDVSFSQDLQDILIHAKWKTPRPLDGITLPHTLSGEDVVVQALSKTSAIVFLTLAHRLASYKKSLEEAPQALVICSSSDVADKACQDFIRLFGKIELTASVLKDEVEDLEKTENTETTKFTLSNILFGTPSSLKKAHGKNEIDLKNVLLCVCRDFDSIKEAGTLEDLEFIFSRVQSAQKIMFAGSIAGPAKDFASHFLQNAKYISLERERATIANVSHYAFLCETPNKFKTLLGLFQDQNPDCATVFANSKLSAAWLYHKLLENGFAVENLAGENAKRSELTENVESGKTKVIVATDYDSRNLSLPQVTHVFNFDLPESSDDYLNRMGMLGKEKQTFVYSLVCEEYGQNYQYVYDLLGQKAPKPIWAKEEYLNIADKSGNPFLEKNIGYIEKRPGRDFGDRERPRRGHDRHDSDRSSGFQRKERYERSDRNERGDRHSNSDRISRAPRNEERNERFDRHKDRETRGERAEQRPMRMERDREDRMPKSSGPQIKPRPRRAAHNPNPVLRPVEPQRKIIPAQKKPRSLLKKILSFFFSKS